MTLGRNISLLSLSSYPQQGNNIFSTRFFQNLLAAHNNRFGPLYNLGGWPASGSATASTGTTSSSVTSGFYNNGLWIPPDLNKVNLPVPIKLGPPPAPIGVSPPIWRNLNFVNLPTPIKIGPPPIFGPISPPTTPSISPNWRFPVIVD